MPLESAEASFRLLEPGQNDDIIEVLEGVITYHERWHLAGDDHHNGQGRQLIDALLHYRFGDPTKLDRLLMPKILDDTVRQLAKRGVPAKSQWPIAVAAAQRAGNIKKGSLSPTKQGVKRGQMSQAQRRKSPP